MFIAHLHPLAMSIIHIPTPNRIVLPLEQSYVLASYFSFWKKIVRALIENAIFYATFLVIFFILFIYLVVVEKIVAL